MSRKPFMKTIPLAAAVTAALLLGGVAQAQSAGTAGGSGPSNTGSSTQGTSGAGMSGSSDTSAPAVSGTGGANSSGMGATGASGTTGMGKTNTNANNPGMDAAAMHGGKHMKSARASTAGVNPTITNDSVYPDPKAGKPTGAKMRKDKKQSSHTSVSSQGMSASPGELDAPYKPAR